MVLIKINGISAFYFSGNSISAVVWTKYTHREQTSEKICTFVF